MGVTMPMRLAAVVLAWWSSGAREGPSPGKLTSGWRLRELGTPVLVARDVHDLEVPDGCTVYASGTVTPDVLARCKVHQVSDVRSEFALDADKRRALLFTAGARDGTLALLTSNADMVGRLETEWRTLAGRAGAYVERLPVSALAGKSGVIVETQGIVQDVIAYRDAFMLRLEDEGHIIGVLVDKDPEGLREERILVRGPLRKDASGYVVLQAEEIRRIR